MKITTPSHLLSTLLLSPTKPGLALDIDETLAWTGGYWLIQMQKLFGNPENLSVEEMFQKYKLCQHVPYYASNPEAMKWIEDRRCCAETAKALPVIETSVECVKEIHENVMPVVVYITVRPSVLADETANWLLRNGFPDAALICRPEEVPFEDGNKWKAKVLSDLFPYVRGIVDDNPSVLLNFVPDDVSPDHSNLNNDNKVVHGYEGLFFLFGHDDNEAKDLLKKFQDKINDCRNKGYQVETTQVLVCPTWEETLRQIRLRAPELTAEINN